MQGPEVPEAMAAVAWEHVICLEKEKIEVHPYRTLTEWPETMFGGWECRCYLQEGRTELTRQKSAQKE